MYVPGPYEFSKESVSDVVARLHAVTSGLSNVQIMMNKEVIMNGHETIFLGTPYLDESDRDWLQRTYNLHHKSPYKIVALTVGSPSGLIHPVAWIHGSEPGFYSAISQNLVPVTCNTRGRMTNLNKTWLRDAFIEIPVNTKR